MNESRDMVSKLLGHNQTSLNGRGCVPMNESVNAARPRIDQILAKHGMGCRGCGITPSSNGTGRLRVGINMSEGYHVGTRKPGPLLVISQHRAPLDVWKLCHEVMSGDKMIESISFTDIQGLQLTINREQVRQFAEASNKTTNVSEGKKDIDAATDIIVSMDPDCNAVQQPNGSVFVYITPKMRPSNIQDIYRALKKETPGVKVDYGHSSRVFVLKESTVKSEGKDDDYWLSKEGDKLKVGDKVRCNDKSKRVGTITKRMDSRGDFQIDHGFLVPPHALSLVNEDEMQQDSDPFAPFDDNPDYSDNPAAGQSCSDDDVDGGPSAGPDDPIANIATECLNSYQKTRRDRRVQKFNERVNQRRK
jgi:hypothetical protein